jgi:fibronectin type 3 domain-containing protein
MKCNNDIMRFFIFPVLSIAFLLFGCEENPGNTGSDVTPPAVPTGITATDGVYRDKVVITWTESEGAETYKILKSIDTEDDFRVIAAEITGSSYDDTTISMSRDYYYKVVAVNTGGESGESVSDLGYANPKLPAKITGLTASNDQPVKVVLSWDAGDNVTHYQIYRSRSLTGEYVEMVNNLTETSYTDESVSENSSYFYMIAGVNIDGTGESSDPVEGYAQCLPPVAPSNLQASDGTYSNKITVTWDAVSSASTYTLFRSDTVDGTYLPYVTGIFNLTYEDLVPADTTCYYAVAAVNPGGSSELSLSDEGNTDSTAPTVVVAPEGVGATDDEYDQVTVSWNAVAGATGYKVFRSDTVDGTYTEIADIATTTYVDTAMVYMQTLYYKVKAYSAGGDSEFSIYDSGYSIRTLPGDPSITSTTVNDTTIPGTTIINWSSSARVDTYTLYRSDAEDGTYSVVADNLSTTTFNDTTAEPAVEFYYRVIASNVGGESNLSTAVMGVAAHPGPENMSAADTGYCTVSLTWDTVQDATSYQIYRANTTLGLPAPATGDYSLITTISHNVLVSDYVYDDSGLPLWFSIYYRIVVIKNGYTGVMSDAVHEVSD